MKHLLSVGMMTLVLAALSVTPGSDSTSGNPNYNTNDTTSNHQGAVDNNGSNGTKPNSEVNDDQKPNK